MAVSNPKAAFFIFRISSAVTITTSCLKLHNLGTFNSLLEVAHVWKCIGIEIVDFSDTAECNEADDHPDSIVYRTKENDAAEFGQEASKELKEAHTKS